MKNKSLENNQPETVWVKPYSPKDLACIYGVGKKTLYKWLEPFAAQIGERQGRYYTAAQVKIIFSNLGLPGIATLP